MSMQEINTFLEKHTEVEDIDSMQFLLKCYKKDLTFLKSGNHS
jgi:hypothetical protein